MSKSKIKADKFLKLFAQKLVEESSGNEIEKLEKAIKALPDGKMKKELHANFKTYSAQLLSLLKEVQPVKQQTNGAKVEESNPYTMYVYNMYTKKTNHVDESVSSLDGKEREDAYTVLLSKQFGKDDVDYLLEAVISNNGEKYKWLDQLHTLSKVTCGRTCSDSLQKLMLRYQQNFTTAVDECISDKKHKGAKKLMRELLQFLVMCHFRRQSTSEPFSKPGFPDLVAALLSSYIDVALLVYRNQEDSSGVGAQLALLVTFLLFDQPTHVLDVIIQMTNVTPGDSHILRPLVSHATNSKMAASGSSPVFVKYVAAVRHLMSSLSEDFCLPFKKDALSVPAPEDFLSWLGDKDLTLLDDLPVEPHFRGIAITKHLLADAEEELISKMIDVLTEDYADTADMKTTLHETSESSPEKPYKQQTAEPDALFFIDTSVNASVAEQFKDDASNGEMDSQTDSQIILIPEDLGTHSDQDTDHQGDQVEEENVDEADSSSEISEIPAVVGDESGSISIIGQLPESCMEATSDGVVVLKSDVTVALSDAGVLSSDEASANVTKAGTERVANSLSDTDDLSVTVPDLSVHLDAKTRKSGRSAKGGAKSKAIEDDRENKVGIDSATPKSTKKSATPKSTKKLLKRKSGLSTPSPIKYTKIKSKGTEVFDFTSDNESATPTKLKRSAKKKVDAGPKRVGVVSSGKGLETSMEIVPSRGRYSLRRTSECSHASADEVPSTPRTPKTKGKGRRKSTIKEEAEVAVVSDDDVVMDTKQAVGSTGKSKSAKKRGYNLRSKHD